MFSSKQPTAKNKWVTQALQWITDEKVTGEKHATILQDVMLRALGYDIIYDNHAGTERGWFVTPEGNHLAVPKISAVYLMWLQFMRTQSKFFSLRGKCIRIQTMVSQFHVRRFY